MKKALLFICLFLSMSFACAEDNVLQSIEIVPVKDSFNIVLVADKSVDVKKKVQAPNKITLDMKGIRASKTLNTVYNNVSNVDTVMVEPINNGISIFFQGENASDATITFDSIAPALPAKKTPETQSVKLNSPIDSYAPIYREDMAPKTTSVFDKIVNKSAGISDDIKDSASESLNKVFSFGLIGLLGYAVIRLFRRREPEMKIGLAQSNPQEREIDMYRGANILQNSYVEKPFTAVNYGLNAYKRENQNPYEQEVTFHNPRLQQYVSPLARQQQTFSRQQSALQAVATAPAQQAVRKHTTPVNTAPVNQSNPNIDNLKFLESMTAIYEKSGRHDLAQGLKASLNKTGIK